MVFTLLSTSALTSATAAGANKQVTVNSISLSTAVDNELRKTPVIAVV
jgi:hypothetical protein